MSLRRFPSNFLLAGLVAATLSGCETTGGSRADPATAQLRAQALAEHAIYRSLPAWKTNVYKNQAALAEATPENTAIEISLNEQRGYLLVKGALAMDFPVATGNAAHPTPAGTFHILAKEKDYHSNLYGRIYETATSRLLVADADSRVDVPPPGAQFVGASMPFWMRLTDSGVGLHVGYVPGVPASHGCVRLKTATAAQIFDLVRVGTPVTIAPTAAVMAGQPSS